MNTLVVNLTRMGDLLQTTPLLKGLKDQDPDGRLDLMVVEDFQAVAHGFRMVDEVIPLDLNNLIPQFEQPDVTVVDLHEKLGKWIESVKLRSYDRLINLSHTRISASLVRLLDVPDTRGVTLSREGYILIRHPWLNYFFNVTLSRTYNPVNLVDMYLGAGDITHSPGKLFYNVTDESKSFADAFLRNQGSLASKPLFGIQPGAMQENRRWPTSNWAALSDLIWENLGGITILFGAEPDIDIGTEIEHQAQYPVINAIGKTTIPQLAGLLTHCQVLLTNDTGTMHLAAAAGTPIVAVFLAAARADDTSPYGIGHLILEANIDCAPCSYQTVCPNPVCHQMIIPEVVLEAVQKHPQRNGGAIPTFPNHRACENVRISMTDVDPWGCSLLRPCIPRPLSRKQVLSAAYRFLWRMELCSDHQSHDISDYHQLLDTIFQSVEPPPDPMTFEDDCRSLDKLLNLASLGVQRADIMAKMAVNSRPDLNLLQNITAQFVVIDNDIYDWELMHPDLAPLAIHFRIEKGNIENDDLQSLARKAGFLYGDLKRRAERFQSLLRETEIYIQDKHSINKKHLVGIL